MVSAIRQFDKLRSEDSNDDGELIQADEAVRGENRRHEKLIGIHVSEAADGFGIGRFEPSAKPDVRGFSH